MPQLTFDPILAFQEWCQEKGFATRGELLALLDNLQPQTEYYMTDTASGKTFKFTVTDKGVQDNTEVT